MRLVSVLIDGRIFSLQAKGGISQMWSYILAAPSWQQQVRTELLLYPGYEKNVHLVGSGLLDCANRTRIIHSPIPSSDNEKWALGEHIDARRNLLKKAGVSAKVVFNTYYGENVYPDGTTYLVIAHDFAHEEVPELRAKSSTPGVLRQKEKALRHADHVVFVSNASRLRFFEHYGSFGGQRTSVIYHGHDGYQPRLGKVKDLILHVGTRGGYKNFSALAVALRTLMATRRSVKLFVMGGEAEDDTVSELQMDFPGRVLFDPAPSDREMDRAMATAAVYVSASKYEGFGIPVLNAMRMGTVPVVSCIPPYREVAGPHGVYFEPTSVDEIINALDLGLSSVPKEPNVWRSWDEVARDYVMLLTNG